MNTLLFFTLGEFGVKEVIFIAIIFLFPYLLPTIIAYSKNRDNKVAIMLINIFLGWTAIGWIASLIWACIGDKQKNNIYITNNVVKEQDIPTDENVADQKFNNLKKLKGLHDSGILSDQEFTEEKAKILGS